MDNQQEIKQQYKSKILRD